MSKTVASRRTRSPLRGHSAVTHGRAPQPHLGLHTLRGVRKYVTRTERQRLIALLMARQSDADLFALTLAFTGARTSEALALTPMAFDVPGGLVAIVTLKRRRSIIRELPIPADLMALLNGRFNLSASQADRELASARVWPFHRATAWRHVKAAMVAAGVNGRAACPSGLRHGFCAGTLGSGVPITLVQRWMGHAQLRTTAIYANVVGPEERAFASSYWRWSQVA